MATSGYSRDDLLTDLDGTAPKPGAAPTTASTASTTAASSTGARRDPVTVRSTTVFDAKGVRLGNQNAQMPPGGYIIRTYTDGSTERMDYVGGSDPDKAWRVTPGAPNASVHDEYIQQNQKADLDAAEIARRQALADKANQATIDLIPAQQGELTARKGEAEARTKETAARTATTEAENNYRNKNQGLSPSEVVAQQQLVQKQAELDFNQKIEEIKARVADGTLKLDKAKQDALDLQNKAANKLAEDMHAIDRQRIASEETRANQSSAVTQRGQDMNLTSSLATTMGHALETERANQMTPAETRNLAKARNYMMNPSGPVPTYEAPTGQLPSIKDQITDMVNQLLKQVSPSAAAAAGGGPPSPGGIAMPAPVAPMAPTGMGGPPPTGASSSGMAALPAGPSPVTGPVNAQLGPGGTPTGMSDTEQMGAASVAARMGNFSGPAANPFQTGNQPPGAPVPVGAGGFVPPAPVYPQFA